MKKEINKLNYFNMTKEEIKDHYKGYENSEFFIECVYEALKSQKPSRIVWFIEKHFMQYDKCDYALMRKCGRHWENVAFGKLNDYDFQHYTRSLLTSASYRMISKTMEFYFKDKL